jgi:hypothetical protein
LSRHQLICVRRRVQGIARKHVADPWRGSPRSDVGENPVLAFEYVDCCCQAKRYAARTSNTTTGAFEVFVLGAATTYTQGSSSKRPCRNVHIWTFPKNAVRQGTKIRECSLTEFLFGHSCSTINACIFVRIQFSRILLPI